MTGKCYHELFGFGILVLFSTIVVRHGYDGEDQVDQVERSHEDDDDEERYVKRTVRFDDLNVHQSHNEMVKLPHRPVNYNNTITLKSRALNAVYVNAYTQKDDCVPDEWSITNVKQ